MTKGIARDIRAGRRPVSQGIRPVAEVLEGRQLLAVITVTSAGDADRVDGSDTLSLRQAIEVANGTLAPSSLTAAQQGLVVGALSTPNTIDFAIPGAGPFIISPATDLPAINGPVVVDGYSQPGSSPSTGGPGQADNAVIKVEISGVGFVPQVGQYSGGLTLVGGDSTVQGLAINGFQNPNPGQPNGIAGILIMDQGNDLIRGNFLGTDATGTAAIPNAAGVGFGGNGNLGATPGVTVGGTTPAARNIISGNVVGIDNSQSADLLVEGNFIGTDRSGTLALGNQNGGVHAAETVGGTVAGAGNLISGNGGPGVSQSYLVEGNLIGTDLTGTRSLGNAVGVEAINGTLLGGTTPAARNVISGNGTGVSVSKVGGAASTTPLPPISPTNPPVVVIAGNDIGTDITGTAPLGNGTGVDLFTTSGILVSDNVISGNTRDGLDQLNVDYVFPAFPAPLPGGYYVEGNAIQGNFIGTDASGQGLLPNGGFGIYLASNSNTIAGNVISGNHLDGLFIASHVQFVDTNLPREVPSADNLVVGNFIGTDPTGIRLLGNSGAGIRDQGSSSTIGGTAAGAGNVIAYNLNGGVAVLPDSSSFPGSVVLGSGQSDMISGNSVHSNSCLGIDLGYDGVTPNVPAGSATGANRLQPYPVLTSTVTTATGTVISATLDALPSTAYTVEFFSSPAADPSGFGQGQTYLGSTSVTTDASGHAAIAFTVPSNLAGLLITATATDPMGDTSEFARDVISSATTPGEPPSPSLTTTTLIGPSTPVATGLPVPFAAVVAPATPGGPAPTGLVAFVEGTTVLGEVPLNASGVALLQAHNLPAGQNVVAAVYLGDASNAVSLSNYVAAEIVFLPPLATLIGPSAAVASGQPAVFAVTVAPPPGGAVPTGVVAFARRNVLLGEVPLNASGMALFATTGLPAGNDAVAAIYLGNAGYVPVLSNYVAVKVTPRPGKKSSGTVKATAIGATSAAASHPSGPRRPAHASGGR